MSKPPTLEAARSTDGRQLIIKCPGCRKTHRHGRHNGQNESCKAHWSNNTPCTCPTGAGDGHRAPHCQHPAVARGYYLIETEGDPMPTETTTTEAPTTTVEHDAYKLTLHKTSEGNIIGISADLLDPDEADALSEALHFLSREARRVR